MMTASTCTPNGLARVDVIYRRIDDLFLDPRRSTLGRVVPGLCAWKAGVGSPTPRNGVADDKAVYTYVPDLIRYYLSNAALPNVPSYVCERKEDRSTFWITPTCGEAATNRGYSMLIGPRASRRAQEFEAHSSLAAGIASPPLHCRLCPP